MKVKSLILFINSIILFTFMISCERKNTCSEREYPLKYDFIQPSQNDLSWVNFNNGDTVIFKSNLNEFDTFFIKKTSEFYHDPVGGGLYNECETYHIPEYASYSIDDTINHAITSILSPNSNLNINPQISWGNRINFDISFFRMNIKNSNPVSITVNGILYNNVYTIQVDSINLTSNMAWKIFYQKENGVLRFDEIGGVKWERIN